MAACGATGAAAGLAVDVAGPVERRTAGAVQEDERDGGEQRIGRPVLPDEDEIEGPLRDVTVCHCVECRRWHGHVCAMTSVLPEQLGPVGTPSGPAEPVGP